MRMRGDYDSVSTCLQAPDIIQRFHGIDVSSREVQQQDVLAADGAFDTGNEGDATLTRVGERAGVGQLAVVQRDRQRLEAERSRAIDQIMG